MKGLWSNIVFIPIAMEYVDVVYATNYVHNSNNYIFITSLHVPQLCPKKQYRERLIYQKRYNVTFSRARWWIVLLPGNCDLERKSFAVTPGVFWRKLTWRKALIYVGVRKKYQQPRLFLFIYPLPKNFLNSRFFDEKCGITDLLEFARKRSTWIGILCSIFICVPCFEIFIITFFLFFFSQTKRMFFTQTFVCIVFISSLVVDF